ncbi:uncharacterized protein [Argopecten irradians]|uniref:uncharacterized protein n=1 Tax=Argopecten irradians TaxID=31199 RepID=UPI003713FC4C
MADQSGKEMNDYKEQGLLHEMFSRQAEATPSQVALVEADGSHMTFKELEDRTNILAGYLRSQGVGTDKCVGIYLNKSINFSLSYIAILKAGGAYLPLDVAYPPPLLQSILSDADPVVIITSPELVSAIPDKRNVLILKEGWSKELETKEQTDKKKHADNSTTLDSLAYVVYSSGTTGKPKGIMCPHRGSVFSYHWRHLAFPYRPDDREACNIFFTWEMLRPLLKGIPMYIIPNTVIYDPPLLCEFLHEHKITRMLFTPSLLEAVLNTSGLDFDTKLKSMRQILFCGEVVTTALFERCLKTLPWIQFLNLYSVSECHDVACEDLGEYFQNNQGAINSRKFCPVGRILPGVEVVILDDQHNPQPVGSSGEIYVGGPTLARGYLNRPEQQAVRFIPRPAAVPKGNGDKLYRTGDWGYMLSDGSLEICGRCDSMVKIRGYSIEVQAVETAILELLEVTACVILVEGDEGDNKFLVAYVVTEGQTSKKALRAALKLSLPFYMIPAYFVIMPSLPIVEATGKLDKKALPPFDKECENDIDKEAQPSTETEKEVAQIWKQVLQIKDVDIQESFFDQGGHSLLATQLLGNLRDKYQVDITVRDLFIYPTIASISQLIEAKKKNSENDVVVPKVTFDLKAEVKRHDMAKVDIDMKLRAFWRSFNLHNETKFKKARVLLTGTTGFLGAFLLRELLLTTQTTIYCVVRELPNKSPADRIEATLKQFGILSGSEPPTEEQTFLTEQFKTQVHAIKGDVALMKLGMNEDDYTYLCTEIDYIIHAAASVNLVYPYSALQGANVNGTVNMVLFACTGKIKPIHYVSTDAVFPNGLKDCRENDDITPFCDQLTDGYSQSKWVAEQLISRADQRGIPVVIYRLGNMSGDMKQAYWNPQDLTLLMLKVITRLGAAPDVDWLVEMTPVDFAAKFLVRMTYNLSTALGKVYHIINSKPIHCSWLYKWMNANGFPVEVIKFTEWRKRVLECTDTDGMTDIQRLLESYIRDESFFSGLSTYCTDNLDKALTELNMKYPGTDGELLKTYFTQLCKQGIISSGQGTVRKDIGPLNGRVAIVTGASSGIGKAIAKTLARAGAKVAMAARRVDRLQEIEKDIKSNGGVGICIQTDVTKRDEVKQLVSQTESILGPVDIMVNNAGTMYYTMMKNLHEDEWERQIDVNIKGLTNGIGAVLDGMVKRQSGHIVNMSSDAGRKGFPGLAVYSGTKFYVEGLSQALRQEVCKSGIRVTCIQPGDVATELLTTNTDSEAKEAYDGSQLCRILDPEDVARAVLYAVTQPPHVGINEILIEPREAPV